MSRTFSFPSPIVSWLIVLQLWIFHLQPFSTLSALIYIYFFAIFTTNVYVITFKVSFSTFKKFHVTDTCSLMILGKIMLAHKKYFLIFNIHFYVLLIIPPINHFHFYKARGELSYHTFTSTI